MAKTEILFCLSKLTFIPSIHSRVKNSAMPITVTLVQNAILGLDLFLNLKIQSLHITKQYCYSCAFLTHACRENYFLRTFEFVSWTTALLLSSEEKQSSLSNVYLDCHFNLHKPTTSLSSCFASLQDLHLLINSGIISAAHSFKLVPWHSW